MRWEWQDLPSLETPPFAHFVLFLGIGIPYWILEFCLGWYGLYWHSKRKNRIIWSGDFLVRMGWFWLGQIDSPFVWILFYLWNFSEIYFIKYILWQKKCSSLNTFRCQRSTESTESTNLIYASPTPVFAPDQKSAPSRLVDYITIIWCIVLHTIRSGSVKVLNKILLQYRSLILPTHTKYGSIISDFTLLIFQHSTAREFKMFEFFLF